MTDETDALVLDLIEWVAVEPRAYAEVMDAWRTSCPRLTIWEDAVDQGYVTHERHEGVGTIVKATPLGLTRLEQAGRAPKPQRTSGIGWPPHLGGRFLYTNE